MRSLGRDRGVKREKKEDWSLTNNAAEVTTEKQREKMMRKKVKTNDRITRGKREKESDGYEV